MHPHVPGLAELSALLSADPVRLRRLSEPNWPAMATLAVLHGLGPVAFRRLDAVGDGRPLPPDSVRTLRDAFIDGAFRAQRLHADAVAALDVLHDAGVRVLALKGLHLSAAYYGEIALRPMGDIDLLVRREQARDAWAALCDLGYAGRERGTEYWEHRLSHHLPRLIKPGAAPIELHLSLADPARPVRLDLELLWKRARPIEIGPHTVPALCAEDLLLHTCLHAAGQHLCRVPLRNIHDIALVIRHQGQAIDWDLLASTAGDFGTRRPLFCGLLLARDLFGADVPESVLESLVPDADRDAVLRMALAAVSSFGAPSPGWLKLAAARGSSRKARGMLRQVFSRAAVLPDATRQVPLGGRIWAYLRRPVNLFLRHRHQLADFVLPRPAARARLRVARAEAAVEAWMVSGE